MAWLGAFLLTQLVEAPVYAWRLQREPTIPSSTRWLVALLPSALTHPLLWLTFPFLNARLPYAFAVALAELVVGAIEAAVMVRFLEGPHRGRDAVAVSVLANTLSVAVGLASRAAFGWP